MEYALNLEDVHRSVAGCLHCNSCHYGDWPDNHVICPIYAADHTFTHTAGGLMFLAKALIRDQLEYTQHLSELVYTCSACRGCDDQCTMMRAANAYMPLSDIIRLMKYEMVKRELIPERIRSLYDKVREHGDLPNVGQQSGPQVPDEILDENSDVVLYGECFHGGGQWNVFENAISLLRKMQQPVAVFAEGGCCGSTLFDHGFWDQLPAVVQAKADRMKSYDGRTFLFVNPHCQEFTTNHYHLIASDFEQLKGQHISELLETALAEGKLRDAGGDPVTVSYHDPCMLGRGLGITEPPRNVLSALEGVEFVEMNRNRKDSFCCGSKAAGKYFDDFRERTAGERIDEFKETGADLLITACHYCKTIFQQALGDEKDRVKDLCEFVDERTTA
jgi:Fe-S oxidoreductase